MTTSINLQQSGLESVYERVRLTCLYVAKTLLYFHVKRVSNVQFPKTRLRSTIWNHGDFGKASLSLTARMYYKPFLK
jgi:hypothetical protein